MITYKKFIPVLTILVGIICILPMSSFTTYNACEFANSNTLFIKKQTQLAFDAKELKMLRYHAYKALTGIEKSKNNFEDCGCDTAIESIDRTKTNLKYAAKAPEFYDAKSFVDIALKNTYLSISALEEFEKDDNKSYGDSFLTLNVKESVIITDDIVTLKGNTLTEKIESGVNTFKTSLDKMIAVNDCAIALNYVQVTNELSSIKSKDESISPGKRYYHKRIKEITALALDDLKNCSKSLTSK